MKTFLTTLGALILLSSAPTQAGDYGKAIAPREPVRDPGCPCYSAGFEFAGFVSGIVPDGSDGELGGGAALSYFYNENFGFEASYSVFDTQPSEEHAITINAVYRFVNRDACFAPYVLAGGGVLTNSSTDGLYNLGAGIDFRFEGLSCMGVFADATYNWVEGDREDFTLIRVGMRIPF